MTATVARLPVAAPAGAAPAVHPLVRATFCLFVASIPFEMPRLALPADVPTLTAALFLATTVLSTRVCYSRVPAAALWFAAYLWVAALAAVVNGIDYPRRVFDLFTWMAELLLVFWAGGNLLRDPGLRRNAVTALVIACALRAAVQVLGIAAEAHAEWAGGARVTAFGQNANLSAMILSAGLAGLVGLRSHPATRPHWPAWVVWPLAAVIGTAVIQTGSRGGIVCAALAVLPFLLQGRRVAVRARNVLVAVAAVGLLSWGSYRSEAMRGRFGRTFEEGSLAGREQIYPAAIAMFAERPLLGWGPVANQFEIGKRVPREPYALREGQLPMRDAHNLVLELLTATGVAGATPFLIGFVLCCRGAWRGRRGPDGVQAVALLAALLPGIVSGTWIASKILWLAMAYGLASGEAFNARPAPAQIRDPVCAA